MKCEVKYESLFVKYVKSASVIFVLVFIALIIICAASTEDIHAKTIKLKKPRITSVSANKDDAITIKWTRVKKAKKYVIYRKIDKNGKWKVWWNVYGEKHTRYKSGIDSYNHGRRYYFKVRAVNGKKKSKFSKAKSYYHKSRYSFKEGQTLDLMVENYNFERCKINKKSESRNGDLWLKVTKNGKKGNIYYFPSESRIEAYIGSFCQYPVFYDEDDSDNEKNYDGYDYEDERYYTTTMCRMMSFYVSQDMYCYEHYVGAWKEGISIYWTLDGTMPVREQEDAFGDLNGYFSDVNRKIRGTVHYGDGLVNLNHDKRTRESLYMKCISWSKAYENDEYIGEVLATTVDEEK